MVAALAMLWYAYVFDPTVDLMMTAQCREFAGVNGTIVLVTMPIWLLLPVFLGSLYFFGYWGRVIESGEWPPPGTRVCVDTRVRPVSEVKWRLRFGRAFPTLVVVLAFVFLYLLRPWIGDALAMPVAADKAACIAEAGAMVEQYRRNQRAQ